MALILTSSSTGKLKFVISFFDEGVLISPISNPCGVTIENSNATLEKHKYIVYI